MELLEVGIAVLMKVDLPHTVTVSNLGFPVGWAVYLLRTPMTYLKELFTHINHLLV